MSDDALLAVARMVDDWGNGLRHQTAHESKMVKAARSALAAYKQAQADAPALATVPEEHHIKTVAGWSARAVIAEARLNDLIPALALAREALREIVKGDMLVWDDGEGCEVEVSMGIEDAKDVANEALLAMLATPVAVAAPREEIRGEVGREFGSPSSEDGPSGLKAHQITMGTGNVDVGPIEWEGKRGILFRPRPNVIQIGEPGELQNVEYWPTAEDVVIWLEESSPAVINSAINQLFPLPAAPSSPVSRLIAEETEACARICEEEAEVRRNRALNSWPGDSWIKDCALIQDHKAITADGLARKIRGRLCKSEDQPSGAGNGDGSKDGRGK